MKALVIVLATLLVAVSSAPPSPSSDQQLAVLPGVEIMDAGPADPSSGTTGQDHQQPGLALLPVGAQQPIPDSALPEGARSGRAAQANTADVNSRLGLVISIGNPAARQIKYYIKSGSCPLTPPVPSILLSCRLQECEEDDDCHGDRKCCRFACSSICVNPDKSSSSGQGHLDESAIDFGGSNNYYNNNYQKPGTCYNPWSNNNYYGGNGGSNYYGRRKRQVAYGNSQQQQPQPLQATPKFGGSHGGNGPTWGNNNPGWGNNNPGWGNNNGQWYDSCYYDKDCPGNKKCCDRRCRTPAVVG